jgi:hypothetical protein
LYYTISDVKKIHNEVKNITQDIQSLNKSITNITSSLMPLLSSPMPQNLPYSYVEPEQSSSQTRNVVLDNVQYSIVNKPQEDDVVSHGSIEIQNLMETIEDEEGNQEETQAENIVDNENIDISTLNDEVGIDSGETTKSIVGDVVDYSSMSPDELKKVSYEDLRKYCKNNNISVKGSKEVLMQRILKIVE